MSPEAFAQAKASTPSPIPQRTSLSPEGYKRITKLAQPRRRPRNVSPIPTHKKVSLSPSSRILANVSTTGSTTDEFNKLRTLFVSLNGDAWRERPHYDNRFSSVIVESEVRLAADLVGLLPQFPENMHTPIGKAQSALHLEILSKLLLRHKSDEYYCKIVMDLMSRLTRAIYSVDDRNSELRHSYFNPDGTVDGHALMALETYQGICYDLRRRIKGEEKRYMLLGEKCSQLEGQTSKCCETIRTIIHRSRRPILRVCFQAWLHYISLIQSAIQSHGRRSLQKYYSAWVRFHRISHRQQIDELLSCELSHKAVKKELYLAELDNQSLRREVQGLEAKVALLENELAKSQQGLSRAETSAQLLAHRKEYKELLSTVGNPNELNITKEEPPSKWINDVISAIQSRDDIISSARKEIVNRISSKSQGNTKVNESEIDSAFAKLVANVAWNRVDVDQAVQRVANNIKVSEDDHVGHLDPQLIHSLISVIGLKGCIRDRELVALLGNSSQRLAYFLVVELLSSWCLSHQVDSSERVLTLVETIPATTNISVEWSISEIEIAVAACHDILEVDFAGALIFLAKSKYSASSQRFKEVFKFEGVRHDGKKHHWPVLPFQKNQAQSLNSLLEEVRRIHSSNLDFNSWVNQEDLAQLDRFDSASIYTWDSKPYSNLSLSEQSYVLDNAEKLLLDWAAFILIQDADRLPAEKTNVRGPYISDFTNISVWQKLLLALQKFSYNQQSVHFINTSEGINRAIKHLNKPFDDTHGTETFVDLRLKQYQKLHKLLVQHFGMPDTIVNQQSLAQGENSAIFVVLAHLFSTRPCLAHKKSSLEPILMNISSLQSECLQFARTMEMSENVSECESILQRVRQINTEVKKYRKDIFEFELCCQEGHAKYSLASAHILRFVSMGESIFRRRQKFKSRFLFAKVPFGTCLVLNAKLVINGSSSNDEKAQKPDNELAFDEEIDPTLKAQSVSDEQTINKLLSQHCEKLSEVYEAYSTDSQGRGSIEFLRLCRDISCADSTDVGEIFSAACKSKNPARETITEDEKRDDGLMRSFNDTTCSELQPSHFVDALIRISHAESQTPGLALTACVRNFLEHRLLKFSPKSSRWFLKFVSSSEVKDIVNHSNPDLQRLYRRILGQQNMKDSVSMLDLADMISNIQVGRSQQDIVERFQKILALIYPEESTKPELVDTFDKFIMLLCAESLVYESSAFLGHCDQLRQFLQHFISLHCMGSEISRKRKKKRR